MSAIKADMRIIRTAALLLLCSCSCSASDTQTASPQDVLGELGELACFRDVVALMARVHPNAAQCVRDKIAKGEPFTDLERQLLLEGIDRLRAAGKCLTS